MRKWWMVFLLLGVVPATVCAQSNAFYDDISRLHDEDNADAILKKESQIEAFIKDKGDTVAANLLFFLADAHLSKGQVTNAITYFERELAVRQTLLPFGETDYTDALYNLLGAYRKSNDYVNGRRIGDLILNLYKKMYGVTSTEYLQSIVKYSDILIQEGDLAEAESILERSLKELPDFSGEGGVVLSKVADVYTYGGKYLQAERLFVDALQLLRISEGETSEIYITTLSNYASLLMAQGKLDKAEDLYDQVLRVSNESEWRKSTSYYNTLNNVAAVERRLGQFDRSEKAYLKLMAADSSTIGTNHPDFSITLSNLSLVYIDQGKYRQAEDLLKKAIDILKSNKATKTAAYARRLNNLAKVYQFQGRLNEAVSLLQEALKIYERNFGKQSPEYAVAVFNLGTTYLFQNSPKALPTLKQALDIREKTLGKSHPLYAECEERIAQYYWMKKNKAETGKLYKNVFDNYYGQVDTFFPALTEEEKANFFYQKVKPSFETFTSFVVAEKADATLNAQLYNHHVNTKGLILFATEKVRKAVQSSGDTTLVALYDTWENTKDILSYYYSVHESQAHIDSLIRVSDELEKSLARKSAVFAKNMDRTRVDWKAIQQKLKPGEASVECVRYRVFNPDSVSFTKSVGYAFLMLTSETKDGPILINLANGDQLETRYLRYYRNGIRMKLDEDIYTFKYYWEPVQDELLKHNINKVYFSPDGVYNTISMGSIKDPFTNKYLIEELDVRRVTSTRTLLEEASAPKEKRVGYLLGFPSYKVNESPTGKKEENVVSSSTGTRSFRGGMLRFLRDGQGITPLPGTKIEINQISDELKSHYSVVDIKLESQALESEVKAVSKPSLLHIATHGYFLDEEEDGALVKLPNPLLKSGLILAGAENFIQTGNNPLHTNEDGILTAYEAMNLDLEGTDLVVLSACETGLGKVQAGEGVYGLQRAFQVAGAKAMIMSLWSVDDTATQMLMNLFYKEYLQTNDLSTSFRNAQLHLMKEFKHPFYWGAFVLVNTGN